MRMGCPVISSNTSAMPEVLGDSCLYFDPHQPKDLVQKLKLLLNDDESYQGLKIAGKQKADGYSWKKSAMALNQLITAESQLKFK